MIDPAKTYRTRDGREVRIYAVDGDGAYSVHGAYKAGGSWLCDTWKSDGSSLSRGGDHPNDLIEVKTKHVRWLNVYTNTMGYPSREEADCADNNAAYNRIACIRIEFEEGEGL